MLDKDSRMPLRFAGTLVKFVVTLEPQKLSAEEMRLPQAELAKPSSLIGVTALPTERAFVERPIQSPCPRRRSATMRYLPVAMLTAMTVITTATAGFAQHVPGFGYPYLKAEQAAGQRLFDDHCAVCHAPKRDQRFGPSLDGLVGRPAASVAGFPYSDALKKSGLVWTEDNLRKWISDPAGTVHNTLMPHVSFSDPAEQMYVIEYLKTLHGSASR